MQALTEPRFTARAVRTVLLLSTLPQLLRFVLNFLLEYVLYGNRDVSETASTVLSAAASFLGTVSLCAGWGALIYLVFLFGIGRGGEWLIAMIGVYVLSLLLLSVVESAVFGFAAFALSAGFTVSMLFVWMKNGRRPLVWIAATPLLSVIGGYLIFCATTRPTAAGKMSALAYGFLNFALEMLLTAVAARIAGLFRRRAVSGAGRTADIAIGGRILPGKHPVLRSFVLTDLLYVLILTASALAETVPLVAEYGWPVNGAEWFSLFRPYLEAAVFFLVGYAVMVFTTVRLEAAFLLSEEEASAAGRYLK